MKVNDRVIVFDKDGNRIGEGIIVNINEFREPDLMYAVDVAEYDDYIFCGESQLKPVDKDEVYIFMCLSEVLGSTYYTNKEDVEKLVKEANESVGGGADFWCKTLERKGE